jgi:hypothetical protein
MCRLIKKEYNQRITDGSLERVSGDDQREPGNDGEFKKVSIKPVTQREVMK